MSRYTRRKFLNSAVSAAASVGLAAPALAQSGPVQLTMSSWLPPQSPMRTAIIDSWVDLVRTTTAGRVEVLIPDTPLAPPQAHLGLLQSNRADIAYSFHGYSGEDAFLRARVGQFSFLGDAYTASHIYSDIYRNDLNAEEEHEGISLLGVFQHGPGVIMLRNKEITRVEDFEGLKIRVPGGYVFRLLESLGAEPVLLSPLEIARSLATGQIDGCCLPYDAAVSFGLMDFVTNVLDLDGGFYNASFFVGMSPDGWAKVPPQDQEIIRQVSDRDLHVLAAKAFAVSDYRVQQALLSRGTPINFVTPQDDLYQQIGEKARVYEDQWVAAVNAQGYDGRTALAHARSATLRSDVKPGEITEFID